MKTSTITVTSIWTQLFVDAVFGMYSIYIKEQEDIQCSGVIEFLEYGSLISGNVCQNTDNRGVINISNNLPVSFQFPDCLTRTYEIRKSGTGQLEARLLVGTNILVTFTLFF